MSSSKKKIYYDSTESLINHLHICHDIEFSEALTRPRNGRRRPGPKFGPGKRKRSNTGPTFGPGKKSRTDEQSEELESIYLLR